MTKNIPAIEVAREYLIVELGKILSENNLQRSLIESIGKLSEQEVWRLLEALSFTYRLNRVFWTISDDGFVWTKENVNCNNLVLTGMNPNIDRIIFSETIQNNPINFRDYLFAYFKKFPNSDPEGLNQFRPKGITIKHPTIILTTKNGKFYLIDGSNRLIAHLLNGNNTINAYVGRKIKDGKIKLGDSTFWLLRDVFEKGDKLTKHAVLTIVKELIDASSDGKKAIETYWISHVRNVQVKEAGKKIIKDLEKP